MTQAIDNAYGFGWYTVILGYVVSELSLKDWNDEYRARVKQFREEARFSQDEMATALGIPKERYAKYENRTPLPPYLIGRFCIITRRTPGELLDGETRRPTRLRVVPTK